MTDKIKFNIDKCSFIKNKKKSLRIDGWAFSEKFNSYLKISVLDSNKCFTDITQYERIDVYNTYSDFEGSMKSGFTINIYNTKENNSLVIRFEDETNKLFLDYDMDFKNIYRENRVKRLNEIKRLWCMKNVSKVITNFRIYGLKNTFRKIASKIANNENSLQKTDIADEIYKFFEEDIPKEWIDIQKYKPKISIIMPLKNIKERKEYLISALNSIAAQIYDNWELCICVSSNELNEAKQLFKENNLYFFKNKIKYATIENSVSKEEFISKAFKICEGDYVSIVEQEDLITKNALAYFIENINQNKKIKIMYSDEDRFFNNDIYVNPIFKKSINIKDVCGESILHRLCLIHRDTALYLNDFDGSRECIKEIIKNTKFEDIKHIDKVLYHYRVIDSVWEEDKENKVKVIAFYLPQFHSIPENDKWWGEGFTEWTNVRKAMPLFDGHYQQRKPTELGYYNLIEDKDVQKKQIELAKKYDIYGFCYYYYWFNGKKLLEKPLNKVLNNKDLDLPFCICWANENWTRRWDGLENEILIEQYHENDSDERLICDIIPILEDDRYIKVNGAPLLVIYKINLLNNPRESITIWRKTCKKYGIDKLHVAIVKHPEVYNPSYYGADSMVEFPPHGMNCKNITDKVSNLKKKFEGSIYDYQMLANSQYNFKKEDYTIFKGCMLQWDNTPRRMNSASIFHNFTIEAYKIWLLCSAQYVKLFQNKDEQIIFINAWNEWAEGTYLEPDEKYGFEYLEATKEVINSR